MVHLIKTLLGLLFFLFLFGILVIKHQPSSYKINYKKEVNLPMVSYKGFQKKNLRPSFLNLKKDKELPLLNNWLINKNIGLGKDSLSLFIDTNKFFSIKEQWFFSANESEIELNHSFEVDFLGKLYLLANPSFFAEIKTLSRRRMLQLVDSIPKQYKQHRYEYIGQTEQSMTYYIMTEGKSNWDNLDKDVKIGHEQIISFMNKKGIPTLNAPFVLYPNLGDKKIHWRAAVATNRYHNTYNDKIKCRKYKGGKNIALIHKGPPTHLKKSWDILMDSLNSHTQAYPAIQLNKIDKLNKSNPLDWETLLLLPIN